MSRLFKKGLKELTLYFKLGKVCWKSITSIRKAKEKAFAT